MPASERTLILVKPDGVQRQIVGRILARYEERGLKLVGLKLVHIDRRVIGPGCGSERRESDAERRAPITAPRAERGRSWLMAGPPPRRPGRTHPRRWKAPCSREAQR